MKALIPAAGQGTRLYPQTHTKPKAMVRLAGKPILGHILDSLTGARIDEVVIVIGTGPLREQIVEYATTAFGDRFEIEFVEQEHAEGLGHSVYQTEELVRGESVLIALGDMLFENGYSQFVGAHDELGDIDGSIGVKRVDEPHHYGIVDVDGDHIVDLMEKPDDPPSNYAISGVYIIEDTNNLFDALEYLVENDVRGAGDEFQLTDALRRMVQHDSDLRTFEVENWYDCGRPETLLEANRVLLSGSDVTEGVELDSSVLIPPVDIGEDVTLQASVVGPNVSVDDGVTMEESIVRDSILGQNATVETVNLAESIIGDNANVTGEANELNVGDNSSIRL